MKDPALIAMELLSSGAIDRDDARVLLDAVRRQPPATKQKADTGRRDDPIAIVGVASHMPKAATYQDFWDVLRGGRDCSERLPAARRELCDVLESNERSYLYGSWIDDIALFDHAFFGITPADALSMDPQQRLFLQTAYHCLEDAGWASRIRGTRTGVYGSFDGGDYRLAHPADSPSDVPGRLGSFAASRLSYWLDLSGPASVTSCTCSSSAMALHFACQGIWSGDCDMALIGGANVLSFPMQRPGLLADASGIMAGDETCHPFATDAKGIGRGEGVIALLIRPLSAALADGDRIRAVIPATAVNNDGRSAMLTAPDPGAQAALLEAAWAKADWDPNTVDYIEAHGTGTQLGDPIEIKAITDAARNRDVPAQSIALGTVKGNIGHLLDGAAGLAGVIKALHVLEHQEVPPTINLTEPSRHIDFLDSPVFVPTEPWPLDVPDHRGLRAGVSCFGFNGTNVHILLESAPALEKTSPASGTGPVVLPLSARSPEALRDLVVALSHRATDYTVTDLAWTLTVGREHHPHRVALVARTADDVRRLCRAIAPLPNEEWGQVAAVITQDSPQETLGDVASALAHAWVLGGAPPEPLPGRIIDAPLYPFAANRIWPTVRSDDTAAAPTESPQEVVLGIVREVLGIDDATADDSFLALGGSSLAALKIQVEVRKSLGAEIDMVDILGADTIAEMTAILMEESA